MTKKPPLWTKKQEQTLTDYWEKGLTSGQISKKMGFSRSAILGKVSRLKLKKRTQNSVFSAKNIKLKLKPIKNSVRVTLREAVFCLDHKQCRFPIGDPQKAGFKFCDKPADKGKQYCAHHHSVCYEPLRSLAGIKSKP